jgi:hypothetical protein
LEGGGREERVIYIYYIPKFLPVHFTPWKEEGPIAREENEVRTGLTFSLFFSHTHGCVYRVREEDKPQVFAYLLQRENMPLPCYFPKTLPVNLHRKGTFHLENDELISALCFVSYLLFFFFFLFFFCL